MRARGIKIVVMAGLLWVGLARPAGAALVIVVPSVTLAANTDHQPVRLTVSGGDAVAGVNLRAVLGNGSAAGAEPVFRSFDFATGTIFSGHAATPTGGPNGTYPQDAQANYALSGAGDQVGASGTFVTAYVSTLGLSSGTYALSLSGTEIGAPTTFVASGGGTVGATITNGSVTVSVPEPVGGAGVALAWVLVLGRRVRNRGAAGAGRGAAR